MSLAFSGPVPGSTISLTAVQLRQVLHMSAWLRQRAAPKTTDGNSEVVVLRCSYCFCIILSHVEAEGVRNQLGFC